MTNPSFPRREDLFLIVSIDGTWGASGFDVNNVSFSLSSFIVGGRGGTTKSICPLREDLLFIDSRIGTTGAYG